MSPRNLLRLRTLSGFVRIGTQLIRRALGPGGPTVIRSFIFGQKPMFSSAPSVSHRAAKVARKVRSGSIDANQGVSQDQLQITNGLVLTSRLLLVEWAVPEPDRSAGDSTILYFVQTLKRLGWEVGLHPVGHGVSVRDRDKMEELGVQLFDKLEAGLLWGSKGDSGLTVLLARPEVAMLTLGQIRRKPSARIIYYTHDLHHLRLAGAALVEKSKLVKWDSKRMRSLESRIFNSVDHILSPSEFEKSIIEAMSPAPVRVVSPFNFPSAEITRRSGSSFQQKKAVLFLGNFAHTPNVDAVLYLAKQVMPIVWQTNSEAKLIIAGNSPNSAISSLASDQIEVRGHVPDLRSLHEQSRFMVAPLRYGAGVKGKVAEALRWGLPVIGSEVAWQGIDLRGFKHRPVSLIASSFASEMIDLLEDDSACARLSDDATQLALAKFSQDSVLETFREVLG